MIRAAAVEEANKERNYIDRYIAWSDDSVELQRCYLPAEPEEQITPGLFRNRDGGEKRFEHMQRWAPGEWAKLVAGIEAARAELKK